MNQRELSDFLPTLSHRRLKIFVIQNFQQFLNIAENDPINCLRVMIELGLYDSFQPEFKQVLDDAIRILPDPDEEFIAKFQNAEDDLDEFLELVDIVIDDLSGGNLETFLYLYKHASEELIDRFIVYIYSPSDWYRSWITILYNNMNEEETSYILEHLEDHINPLLENLREGIDYPPLDVTFIEFAEGIELETEYTSILFFAPFMALLLNDREKFMLFDFNVNDLYEIINLLREDFGVEISEEDIEYLIERMNSYFENTTLSKRTRN